MAQTPSQQVWTQIPLYTNWRSTDSVNDLAHVLREHEYGIFYRSSTLWEEMLSDDRIGAVIDTRIGGILSANLHFQPAEEGHRKSKKLADILGGHDQTEDDGLWLRMMDPDTAAELLKWKIGLGMAFGPIVWDTRDGEWVPRVIPWHPRFLRYDWGRRAFVVIAQEGPEIVMPRTDEEARGDGKWFFWGGYRSWMTGLIRSLGMKYIDRNWTERDWARYCEKYGLNIIEGKVPSGATDQEKEAYQAQLVNLGNEPTIVTPQGRSKDDASFGLEIHECTAQGWQAFKSRKESLDTDIAVRVLGQNLTTEVKGGSLAASKVHEGIRGDVKRRDAHFFKAAREQLLCWWAFYNFGDPELAPYPRPEIEAALDPVDEATQLLTLMQAMQIAPPEVDAGAILEAHGVPVLEGDALAEKIARMPAQPVPGALPGAPAKAKTVSDGTAGQMAAAMAGGGDEPKDDTEDTTKKLTASIGQLVALKAGTVQAKRQASYSKTVAARARRLAGQALAPMIQGLMDGIDKAQSFDDIKRLVVVHARKRGAGVPEIAKLIEQVNILAHLQGREDVLHSVMR
jgi:hypothetical protein